MGGHDNLAQKLRGYARHMQQAMAIDTPTVGLPFCDAVTRSVLILGKMEHGKSTLRSQMLTTDNYIKFMTTVDCLKVLVQALFLSKTLNLVVIVLKYERCFDPIEQKILKTVISKWQVGRISALVLTHCEH
ncbi:MAG: hypothetical protein MJE68_24065 [Proteobacteria bacterium]|nr:hypothetical protein [Pseudomonadota bacterium]